MTRKLANIDFKNNQFLVTGELDFFNVMSIYKKSLTKIKKSPELNFDFSQLKSSDSAGLALIMEWIKLAKQNSKTIRFENLPHDLITLAKASSLDTLILARKN